jgi:hypothetical protein
MTPFFCRVWTIALLVGLIGYVILKGVVPAVSEIDADFPSYFTAARIVRDGQDTARLYDDAWFQQQMRRYGLESAKNPGKFAPFPPPTALLLVPLARFSPLAALRIVTLVSVVCLFFSMLMLVRMFGWKLLDAALFVLSSGAGIISCLRFGQPYILVSTLCILGFYLYRKGKPWLAGICLGLFVPIKYYPVIVLAVLTWRQQWKVLLDALTRITAVTFVRIGVLGWQVHETFLRLIFGNHLVGYLSLQDRTVPFTAVYQSFDTLFSRLFVFDPAWNPRPLLAAPFLRTVSLLVTKAGILLVAVATLVRLARSGTANAVAPSIGLLGILVLLIAPATATYTYVLLWLPVALLIDYFLAQKALIPAYFILGTYIFIGFIPYGHTYPFEGHGGLTVLAYPRLFLLLTLFIGCVYFLARQLLSSRWDALPNAADRLGAGTRVP